MITRKTLTALAVFVLADFAVTALLGNPKHGVRGAFADITWMAFLLGMLFLVVGCVTVIVRSRRQPAA